MKGKMSKGMPKGKSDMMKGGMGPGKEMPVHPMGGGKMMPGAKHPMQKEHESTHGKEGKKK